MKLKVLLFAGLRERVGCGEVLVEVPPSVQTVADLRAWLATRGQGWEALTTQKNLRSALDQLMLPPAAEATTALGDAAEVAFFPPVTGG